MSVYIPTSVDAIEHGTAVRTPFRWEHANDAARAAESVTHYEIGLLAWQTGDDSVWVLSEEVGPTWIKVSAGSGVVEGSGTLNTIPKWTPDGSTLGDSLIFDDGTNVGVGLLDPEFPHEVKVTDSNSSVNTIVGSLYHSTASPVIGCGVSLQFCLDDDSGFKDYPANIRAVWSDPSTGLARSDLFLAVSYEGGNTDALKISPSGIKIGDGLAGIDYTLTFDGETNDGLITWMEDEDYFDFLDTVKTSAGRIQNTTRITSADSPYTILVTDHKIFADTDGGAITVNYPVGVDGTEYEVRNTGSSGNNVTLSPNGAELFFGVNADDTLYDGEVLSAVYETTEGWF